MMRYSEQTTELFAALSAFQGEVTNPTRTAENPYFKSRYTQLDSMIDHVRETLTKHGLSVIQMPCSSESGVGVVTVLSHKSGQFVESDPYYLKLSKQDAQAGGSAITYARRYAFAAILGIASDTDDDGNAASAPQAKESKRGPRPGASQPTETDVCCVCDAIVTKEFADKSREANGGKVYCTGTCRDQDKGESA